MQNCSEECVRVKKGLKAAAEMVDFGFQFVNLCF